MPDTRYSKEHEWIRPDSDTHAVGITPYAEQQLGDIVYVEPPEVGRTLNKNAEAGVVESVKAVSDIFAPVAGQVTEINQALVDDPALINADPDAAWLFRIRITDPSQLDDLMDADAYADFVDALS